MTSIQTLTQASPLMICIATRKPQPNLAVAGVRNDRRIMMNPPQNINHFGLILAK